MSEIAKLKAYPTGAEIENRVSAAYAELCAKGKLFTGIKRPKGFRQMTPKECFYNAQRVDYTQKLKVKPPTRRLPSLKTGKRRSFVRSTYIGA